MLQSNARNPTARRITCQAVGLRERILPTRQETIKNTSWASRSYWPRSWHWAVTSYRSPWPAKTASTSTADVPSRAERPLPWIPPAMTV